MRKILFYSILTSLIFLTACAKPSNLEKFSTEETSLNIETISITTESETEFETITEIPTESETKFETITETPTESETESETVTERIPPDGELVRILDYIPDAVIDLRYATENNFTHTVIYDDTEAYLCYGTVKKLILVQEALKENGFLMIIWDAYRPVEAQQKLWDVCPNPTYVANPEKGITSHSRGNTIDIGIVYADGSEAELPSAFDEFSELADRDYSDVPEKAKENSCLLEKIMTQYGFTGYYGEWWDYSDTETYELVIP